MSRWTLREYVKQLRVRLDEPDQDLFTDDELITYINEGIKELSFDLKKEMTGTKALTDRKFVDFREVFVTSDQKAISEYEQREHNFLQLRSVYIGDEKLIERTPEQIERGEKGFYIWGETIVFDQKYSGELIVLYIGLPQPMVALTDKTPLPQRFQHIPLEYAIAKAKQKDEEYGLYSFALDQFRQMKFDMKLQIERQNNSTGTSTINTNDYY